MLKKTLIAAAVMAASTGLAFANGGTFTPHVASSHTGGFYIGVGVIHDSLSYELSRDDFFKEAISFEQLTARHELSDHNWGGEFFAGYGVRFCQHYYLGAEIFGARNWAKGTYNLVVPGTFTDLSTAPPEITHSFGMSSTSVEVKYNYGVSLIPGIFLTKNTMLYGRIGWTRGRVELTNFGTGLRFLGIKKSVNGIQLGLGLEAMLSHCFSIRGEYDWSRYGSISGNSQIISENPGSASYRTIKASHPEVGQFTLAGILRFGGGGVYVPPNATSSKDSLSKDHQGNFYIGMAAGRELSNYNAILIRRFSVNNPSFIIKSPTTEKRGLGRHSWNGEIFGGYGAAFNKHYYLGAEAFGSSNSADSDHVNIDNFLSADQDTTALSHYGQVNIKYSYGLSLIPGVMVTPRTMLYGRVGWVGSHVELLYLKSLGPQTPAVIDLSERLDGVQLGLGLETRVKGDISLRAEYDWTRYCSSLKGRTLAHSTSGTSIYDNDITLDVHNPETSKFSFAAIYHFVS